MMDHTWAKWIPPDQTSKGVAWSSLNLAQKREEMALIIGLSYGELCDGEINPDHDHFVLKIRHAEEGRIMRQTILMERDKWIQ